MQAVARRGVAGAAAPYPHGERIRAAFGRYAPAGLAAHMGPAARAASGALSAGGYVFEGRAAFAGRPDLHTAAHEAFHLFEHSRARPAAGAGVRGDRSEIMADRVADRVASGRSVESLLADAALAPPPALQMVNHISAHTDETVDNPWTEIDAALGLPSGRAAYGISVLNPGRFNPMLEALKKQSAKARSVTATLDGQRPGKIRKLLKTDGTQSAYGALGSLEALLTDTETPAKYDFEGGHLIADEMLGEDSYVQYNFAPQRDHFNSPIYRKIEEIAMAGISAKDSSVTSDPPDNWTMKTDVTYSSETYTTSTDHLVKLLGLSPSEITVSPIPPSVTLTGRVPALWVSKVDSGSTDYVFNHESTIDPTATGGANLGYLGDESKALAQLANVETYVDANYWGMDSLKHAPRSGVGLGTGSLSSHTFTGVQAVPRGQKAWAGPVAPTLPAVVPYVAPTMKRSHSFSEIPETGWENPSKRRKATYEMAGEILDENSGVPGIEDLSRDSIALALETSFMFKRRRQPFAKKDIVTYRSLKGGRGGRSKVSKQSKTDELQARQVIIANFSNTSGSVNFS